MDLCSVRKELGAAESRSHLVLRALARCSFFQDEEDAKRGMYNWFAQSQRLLTPIRVLIGTGTLVLVPYLLLPLHEVRTAASASTTSIPGSAL